MASEEFAGDSIGSKLVFSWDMGSICSKTERI